MIVDVPGMLAVKVTIMDDNGAETPDPNWNREAAETQYVFAEFLADKGLLIDGVSVTRHPELIIRRSQLTNLGFAFAKSDMDKWMRSIDRTGTPDTVKRSKLEKRWTKFLAAQTDPMT